MKTFMFRLVRTLFGAFLCALGIALTIQANIGLAPWEAFHSGFSIVTGLSFGTISVLTGAAVIIISLFLKEIIGISTVLNMLLVGPMIDLIRSFKIIPMLNDLGWGVAMLLLGQFINSIGSYFYIGAGLGSGPRDSLMFALAKRFKRFPLGAARGAIEASALLIGWLLGAKVGVGTIITVFGISFILQYTFKMMRFQACDIQHESLFYTKRFLEKQLLSAFKKI